MSRGELHRRGDITGRKFFRVCMAWYARHVVTKNMRVVVLGRRELAFLAWMDPHHGARRLEIPATERQVLGYGHTRCWWERMTESHAVS